MIDRLLVGGACSAVFLPWLLLELLGGRAAVVALTGMNPEGAILGLAYLVAWTWMVFGSVPALAASVVFLMLRRRSVT